MIFGREFIQQCAKAILESHNEYIEFCDVVDYFWMNSDVENLHEDELEKLFYAVHDRIGEAKITITWEDA